MRQAAKHSARPEDAEDALQDACVQFLAHYQGEPGVQALRWMMLVSKRRAWAIAAHHRNREVLCELSVTDAPRQPERPVIVAEADAELDPAQLSERAEQRADRLAALARLKSDERTALLLLGLGLSYAEIAARQHWTKTKVNRCLAEGREALRRAGQFPAAAPRSQTTHSPKAAA
jgi:RNA polymerase sigma factor (sigma-70 family)